MTGRAIPLIGWGSFYAALAASWSALALMAVGREPASLGPSLDAFTREPDAFGRLLDRCLATANGIGILDLALMWGLMSLAMMMPTALPALRTLATVLGRFTARDAAARFAGFLAGYAAVWLGFSLAAAALQSTLADAGLLDSAGRVGSLSVAALLLALAGLYQFSHLKHACLRRCRHPMTFFITHWSDGFRGALVMGLMNGRDCLGCCWALMLLAFVGGTMNIGWMAAGMALMVVEKLAGPGRYVTAPLGLVLVTAAGFTLGNAIHIM